jgi:hypothetical protein
MRLLIIILIGKFANCFPQSSHDTSYVNPVKSYQTFIPDMISTHPLGVFMSNINSNFQTEQESKYSISINISNGNVWLPHVKGYIPVNQSDINSMERILWHGREGIFDRVNTPSKTMDFHADGVYRVYQLKLNIPVYKKFEFRINVRSFSIDEGNSPFSLLTSDQFIEWFHSNIKGGEDPFARKVYGFNKEQVTYTDQKGKTFSLSKGDYVFSGLDFSYYYYPRINFLKNKNICLNFGLQTGINVTRINPALDFGLNSTINKYFIFGSKKKLQLAYSSGIMRQKLLKIGEGVQICSSKFLFTSELLMNYQKQVRKKSFISIGTTYFIHSPYNNKEEYKYIVLTGERISSHWHYALSHLYRTLTYNTFYMSFTKGCFSISTYLKEDLLVDNAPDFQTGIGFKVNL